MILRQARGSFRSQFARDLVKFPSIGADFGLLGRAFAYGLGAGGAAGAGRSFAIMRQELSLALGQIGRPRFAAVDAGVLAACGGADPLR